MILNSWDSVIMQGIKKWRKSRHLIYIQESFLQIPTKESAGMISNTQHDGQLTLLILSVGSSLNLRRASTRA